MKLAVDQTKIAISKVIIYLSGFIFSSCFLLDIDNIWKRVIYMYCTYMVCLGITYIQFSELLLYQVLTCTGIFTLV